MNKSSRLLLPMATLLIATSVPAEQSGFITPEQSATIIEKKQATASTEKTIKLPMPTLPTATALGYLGIGFDNIPASIRAHLPDNITAQQGLLVTRFADNSPAADDGMKVSDVLLTYDGQPINTPENFIKMIRDDKAGRIVKFTLLRQGNILTLPVTMGSQKKKIPVVQQQLKTTQPSITLQQMPAPNANYNGLAIRKIGDGIYDASIGIIGQNGKPQRRSFKGNRLQILQQIMQASDLPPQARQQLLFAVQPRQQQPTGWGGMPNMPFSNGGNFFNPNQFFKGWN
jgi:membrane-associated protease RseP (regulator of RpoE activity)